MGVDTKTALTDNHERRRSFVFTVYFNEYSSVKPFYQDPF